MALGLDIVKLMSGVRSESSNVLKVHSEMQTDSGDSRPVMTKNYQFAYKVAMYCILRH